MIKHARREKGGEEVVSVNPFFSSRGIKAETVKEGIKRRQRRGE